MSSQKYIPPETKEEVVERKRAEAERLEQWRVSQLRGMLNGGNSASGRMIDWNSYR
jgi:hypothetical protein